MEALINNFALRSFRDVADRDYIAARMASRAALMTQYLWFGQQAVEKYLKCILLLNRIPATNVRHDLAKAMRKIEESGRIEIDISQSTRSYIRRLNEFGIYRYLEISTHGLGTELVDLDRTVWDLRRYATLAKAPREAKLQEGHPAPRVSLPGGTLEIIMADKRNPAREPLLWQNAYFGKRARRIVHLRRWFHAQNSPIYLNPQILDEVLKYVFLPKEVVESCRQHAGE